MRIEEWMASFTALHDQARRGVLPELDRRTYDGAREELARALLSTRKLSPRPGQTCRAALRVPRALQVEITLASGKVRVPTLDLSPSGFTAIVGSKPSAGERASFELRLPGGAKLAGDARVAALASSAGSTRVTFELEELSPADAERLELLVFDAVLEQLKPAA